MDVTGWVGLILWLTVALVVFLPVIILLLRCLKIHRMENIDWESYRDKYERPLGSAEKIVYLMKEICTPMTSALGLTSSVPVTEDVLNETLRHLMNVQTLLRMCVRRNKNGALYFRKIEDDILKKIKVEVRNDKDWQVVVDQNKRDGLFSENGPLWKCIFLPNATMNNPEDEDLLSHNCVVIFIQDHVINDGVGTVEMMKNFMFFLNELLAKHDLNTDIAPPVLPEDYYLYRKHPLSTGKKVTKLFSRTLLSFQCFASLTLWMMKKFMKNVFVQHVGVEKDRNPDCEEVTKVKLQIFSKEDTKALVTACRNNGCTVQGVLQAVGNVAVSRILLEHGAQFPLTLMTYVPVDMRRRGLEIPDNSAGVLYAGGLNIDCDIEESALEPGKKYLWKKAKDSTIAVREEIEKKQYLQRWFEGTIMSILYDKYYTIMEKVGREAVPLVLVVSSLGRFEVSKSSAVLAKPLGFLFSLTATRSTGPIFAMYVATLNGRLSISHTYFPHITSESLAEQYCSKCLEILKSLIDDTDTRQGGNS